MSEHFNKLTPAEVERLALLSEECGEVIQAIGKILRHGYESCHPDSSVTNRENLEREIGDAYAAMTILIENEDVRSAQIRTFRSLKLDRVGSYLHHQQ